MKTTMICLGIATLYWALFQIVDYTMHTVPCVTNSIYWLILELFQTACLLVALYLFGYAIEEKMMKKKKEQIEKFHQDNPQIPRISRFQ